MRFSKALIALPFLHSAIAAPLIGGLLGGGGGGLLGGLLGGGGGTATSPAPAPGPGAGTGTDGHAADVLDIVTQLGNAVKDAFCSEGSIDYTDLDQLTAIFDKGNDALEEAVDQLEALKDKDGEGEGEDEGEGVLVINTPTFGGLAGSTPSSLDEPKRDEEAAEPAAQGLAQIIDSIEDVVTKASEDLDANGVLGRLFTTVDNNLFLVLQAAEELVPGILDRVESIVDKAGDIVDNALKRVDNLLSGFSVSGA